MTFFLSKYVYLSFRNKGVYIKGSKTECPSQKIKFIFPFSKMVCKFCFPRFLDVFLNIDMFLFNVMSTTTVLLLQIQGLIFYPEGLRYSVTRNCVRRHVDSPRLRSAVGLSTEGSCTIGGSRCPSKGSSFHPRWRE
jgi:hypothetical protein